MAPEASFDIHTDPMPPGYNHVRILFPLKGGAGTFTQFYTASKPPTIHWIRTTSGNPQPYEKFEAANCEFVTQVESKIPYLIHTQPPHGIYNPNKEQRITLWIDFNDQLDLKSQIPYHQTL
jgi:hypothetical protein